MLLKVTSISLNAIFLLSFQEIFFLIQSPHPPSDALEKVCQRTWNVTSMDGQMDKLIDLYWQKLSNLSKYSLVNESLLNVENIFYTKLKKSEEKNF